MAGVTETISGARLSRAQFGAIAQLRWRLLVNSLRKRGGKAELVAQVLRWPFFVALGFGPAVGAGFGAYFAMAQGKPQMLSLILWGIFLYWQFLGLTLAVGEQSFDVSSLILYPLSFRDYFLARLLFELLDAPTLLGCFNLLSVTVGVGLANRSLLPWAAVVMLALAVANILFSRMLFAWLDRWLSQRRTRELATGILILLSLSFQLIAPQMRRSYRRQAPEVLQAVHWLEPVANVLPPGAAAVSIGHMKRGAVGTALLNLTLVVAYCVGLLWILGIRIRAQYRGESLSETAMPSVPQAKAAFDGALHGAGAGWGARLLPATVAACLEKEVRYMLRTSPMIYNFIMPVFMVFIFSSRGTRGLGMSRGFVFPMAVAYALLVLANLLYNAFGSDGVGVQFYFLAPVRIRDVVVAKNIAISAMLALEVLLVWVVVAVVKGRPHLDLTVGTLSWLLFALLLNLIVGNLRSIYSPRKYDMTKVRRQGSSQVNALISLGVLLVGFGAGVIVTLISLRAGSLWWATPAFLLLAAIAFVAYLEVLGRLDGIALNRREVMAEALAKA